MTLTSDSYHDTSGWEPSDVLSGGSRMIPITTPSGAFRVWTKRVGTNADLKVLLLHGGPGASDELFECFDTWFPRAVSSTTTTTNWGRSEAISPTIQRCGTSTASSTRWNRSEWLWVSMPATSCCSANRGEVYSRSEYAFHHGANLKGLIISNMMSSAELYNQYAEDVLMPTMDQAALSEIKQFEAEGDTDNPRYEQLLMEHHYLLHVCRLPLDEWPDPVQRALAHINPSIYVPMQGPSELGLSGTLLDWDRSGDLGSIDVPTLTIGATHDTMDPDHMRWMVEQLPRGRYLHCPDGSHLSQFDDPQHYFPGLIDFLLAL